MQAVGASRFHLASTHLAYSHRAPSGTRHRQRLLASSPIVRV